MAVIATQTDEITMRLHSLQYHSEYTIGLGDDNRIYVSSKDMESPYYDANALAFFDSLVTGIQQGERFLTPDITTTLKHFIADIKDQQEDNAKIKE